VGQPALLFVLHVFPSYGFIILTVYEVKELSDGKKGGIAEAVRRLAQPYAEKLGLTLWDVRYVREGGAWYLRILIDKPGGVSIDDCEKLSRTLDGPLDEQDPVPGPYCLEVSSPGINRELTRPEHFEKYLGSRVTVRLFRPLPGGSRILTGRLISSAGGEFVLAPEEGENIIVSRRDVSSVRLREDDFVEGIEES